MTTERGPAAVVLRADRLLAARRALVARQVELTAAPGDVVAVEGANGAGKSTLLAAAAGCCRPDPGACARRRWVTRPSAPMSCPGWRSGAG